MFRPPYLARVAAGATVYALEETRRLPSAALHLPITAISQLLQTSMHVQQFVTSLALRGDEVFDRLVNRPEEQPEWATFDEDLDDEQSSGGGDFSSRFSRFDLTADPDADQDAPAPLLSASAAGNGYATPPAAWDDEREQRSAGADAVVETAGPAPETEIRETTNRTEPAGIVEPEVAARFDYANMTIAQLRARLRMLTVEDLRALLEYEQATFARAPFVTMLNNRIATVQAK